MKDAREKVSPLPVDEKFRLLSCEPRHLQPIELTGEDVVHIRRKLVEVGFKLEGLPEEALASLQESQFRNLETGRGPGVVAVIGQGRASQLLSWCRERAKGWARILNSRTGQPIEGTEGRGLQQAVADIITIGVLGEQKPELVQELVGRINRRVMKGNMREYSSRQRADLYIIIAEKFSFVGKPPKTLASIPPGSFYDFWNYLTSTQP